jgi:hypothetical protein
MELWQARSEPRASSCGFISIDGGLFLGRPQYKFPVPEGILDYSGTNTVAVALWAMEDIKLSPSLHLEIDGVYDGGVGVIATNNPRWTPEGRE